MIDPNTAEQPPRFVPVAPADALEHGKLMKVDAEGREICLVNWKGTYYALDNACPHWGVSLEWGWLHDGEIMCSWHGYRYNLATGRSCDWYGTDDLPVYPVKVEDGQVLVGLPAPAKST